MPQHSKGIRLWLRPARGSEKPAWVIRDGGKQVRTGCAQSELVEAQRNLADYVARKYEPDRSSRAPSQVRIADVLNIYSQDVAPTHARPYETAHRLAALAEYWGDRPLSAVNGKTCREYVTHAGTPAAARRHLEDFRAAIIHHRREGFCSEVVEVVLPDKGPPRERWLTRSEAARLLWACWRGGQGRRKHIARFILVGIYTGTRASAICGASLTQTPGRGYVDLEHGVFYRRAVGAKETDKRQPPVRLPPRLLAHMRRWQRVGASQAAVVEYEGLSSAPSLEGVQARRSRGWARWRLAAHSATYGRHLGDAGRSANVRRERRIRNERQGAGRRVRSPPPRRRAQRSRGDGAKAPRRTAFAQFDRERNVTVWVGSKQKR
jgi:hypothetical protein